MTAAAECRTCKAFRHLVTQGLEAAGRTDAYALVAPFVAPHGDVCPVTSDEVFEAIAQDTDDELFEAIAQALDQAQAVAS